MATAKQIAAAKRNIKKAQAANRRKGRGGGGGGGNRRKPIVRGIVGRLGAFMIGVIPPAIATTEAASIAIARRKEQGLSVLGTIHLGLLRWVNNMTKGYANINAFEEADIGKEAGGTWHVSHVDAGVPGGSLLTTTGVGLLLMLIDAVASKLAGGRPVKVLGTNYNATGGS